MKKWLFIGAIFLSVIGLCWWFWTLGSVPRPTEQAATISIESGITELRRGTADWRVAVNNERLFSKDAVRTNAGARATIHWFGGAESRLDQQTEISITDASFAADPASPFTVRLGLVAGRMWSRVLRLLDLNATYSVQANNVVATVRGTTFDLESSSTGATLAVTESAVQTNGENMPVVSEGRVSRFDARGRVIGAERLSDEARSSVWFEQNRASDAVFVSRARSEAEARLASLGGAEPESITDAITRVSERAHLSFAGAGAPSLSATYAIRRLNRIRGLVDQGKSGLAFQSLSRLEDDVREQISGPDGGRYREALRISMKDIIFLLDTVGPSSPSFRLKQRIEDLRTSIEDPATDPASALYARLIAVESSVDAAEAQLSAGLPDTARELLDTSDQGIQNVERDTKGLTVALVPSAKLVINGKLDGLKLRSASLREALNAAPTSTASETATTTTPIVTTTSTTPTTTAPVVTIPTSTQPVAALGITKIQITGQPNPADAGTTVRFTVMGTKPDGSTIDVTSKAQFQRFGNLGTLNGPTFVSPSAGSVTIQATVRENGQDLNSSMTLTILVPKPVLSSLTLAPIGNTTISPGSRLGFAATAKYSDGTTKDVTSSATYFVSDPKLGAMNGATFVSGQSTGIVTVTSSFADGGITKTGWVDLTIALQ